MIEVIEESLDVGFYYIVERTELQLIRQLEDRVQGGSHRPVAIAARQEILLVDGLQYPGDRQLQQLILRGRYTQRPLSSIRLGYVLSPHQLCMVEVPLEPLNEVPDILVQILLVFLGAYPVNAVGGVFSDRLPTVVQKLLIDQRVEALEDVLFPFLCL